MANWLAGLGQIGTKGVRKRRTLGLLKRARGLADPDVDAVHGVEDKHVATVEGGGSAGDLNELDAKLALGLVKADLELGHEVDVTEPRGNTTCGELLERTVEEGQEVTNQS